MVSCTSYKTCSLYLVQLILLYMMVRSKWFGRLAKPRILSVFVKLSANLIFCPYLRKNVRILNFLSVSSKNCPFSSYYPNPNKIHQPITTMSIRKVHFILFIPLPHRRRRNPQLVTVFGDRPARDIKAFVDEHIDDFLIGKRFFLIFLIHQAL